MDETSQIRTRSLPSVVKMRPMLMFTGFLGAGKTTLLRELLEKLVTKEILSDVILNDRENAYIDRARLKGLALNAKALTGACVCCDGYHDIMDMMHKSAESKTDVLLIELNGTSDPTPLLESFTLLESKFVLRPRWQICVIDPRHFGERSRFKGLEALQLETASHYYISWSTTLSADEESKIEEQIKVINPRASRTNASQLAEDLDRSIQKNQNYTLVSQKKNDKRYNMLDVGVASSAATKSDERHALAHEFTGCQILIPEPVESSRIGKWLEKLPDSVIRVKALICKSSDADQRYLYERVGDVISPEPEHPYSHNEVTCSGVFIGADLDPVEILKITREYLHPACHFPE